MSLKPLRIAVVILLAVVSVAFMVMGPKILGNATNILFDGVVSSQIPAGVTQDQAVAELRAKGQNTQADMLAGMTIQPGEGVDFTALERTLLASPRLLLLDEPFTGLDDASTHALVARIRALRDAGAIVDLT